jgi:2-amino-4-hydroxy-6-hydroxymethyldihydropteridine diphosphokinase
LTSGRRRIAYVGVGTNLGDRRENLRLALEQLERGSDLRVLRCSGLYETAPVGVVDQPWFLNGVAEIETDLAPRQVLKRLKDIEQELGRQPSRRWGERLIDLDLLLYGDDAVRENDLVVPHPELWNRLFVLRPLAELFPDLEAPDGRTIQEAIALLDDAQIVRPLSVDAANPDNSAVRRFFLRQAQWSSLKTVQTRDERA